MTVLYGRLDTACVHVHVGFNHFRVTSYCIIELTDIMFLSYDICRIVSCFSSVAMYFSFAGRSACNYVVLITIYVTYTSFNKICNSILRYTCKSLTKGSANMSQRDVPRDSLCGNFVNCCRTVRKISFENACNRRMTLKVTQGHRNCHILLPISGL